jgi:hypothetical protein
MTQRAEARTDARLDDLAAMLQPVPAQLGMLGARVAHFEDLAARMEPLPAQIAVLAAGMEHLAHENRALRAELAGIQRQLVQISWALVAALLGAGAAVLGAVL